MSEQRDFQKTVCELHETNIRQQREITQLRDRIHKVFARLEELHNERLDLRTANSNLLHTLHATKQTLDKAWSKANSLENDLACEQVYRQNLEHKIVVQKAQIADLQHEIACIRQACQR